jgi:hypothetical protein
MRIHKIVKIMEVVNKGSEALTFFWIRECTIKFLATKVTIPNNGKSMINIFSVIFLASQRCAHRLAEAELEPVRCAAHG